MSLSDLNDPTGPATDVYCRAETRPRFQSHDANVEAVEVDSRNH